MVPNLQKFVAVVDYDELLIVNPVFWNIRQNSGKLWLKQNFGNFLKKSFLPNLHIYLICRVSKYDGILFSEKELANI
jgi:hypothetical protein